MLPFYKMHQSQTQQPKPLFSPLDKPKWFKTNGHPKATAGLFLYINHENEVFILFGEEAKEKAYSELSGSLEVSNTGEAETFAQGALREAYEESCGLYDLKEEYLTANAKVYAEERPGSRQVMMFLVEAPEYHSAPKLNYAQQAAKLEHQKEKTDYQWIRARDLLTLKPGQDTYTVQTLENETQIMRFRDYCLAMMQKDQFQAILRDLVNSTHHKNLQYDEMPKVKNMGR